MHNEALVEWVPAKVGITLWGRFIPGSRVTTPPSTSGRTPPNGRTPNGVTPTLHQRPPVLPPLQGVELPPLEMSPELINLGLEPEAPQPPAAPTSHLVRGMKRNRGGLDSFFAVKRKREHEP